MSHINWQTCVAHQSSDHRRAYSIGRSLVHALAGAIDPRYRALVLLGTFASLRWAELAALRPGDIDLELCTIRVDRQLIEQLGGAFAKVGRPGVHFHDLRHTGNALTADEGANLRELMDRMGP